MRHPRRLVEGRAVDKEMMGRVVLLPLALDGGRVWVSGARWKVLWGAG